MTAQDHVEYIKDRAAVWRTAFILGKYSADPASVSLQEFGQIDTKYIDEVRDEPN